MKKKRNKTRVNAKRWAAYATAGAAVAFGGVQNADADITLTTYDQDLSSTLGPNGEYDFTNIVLEPGATLIFGHAFTSFSGEGVMVVGSTFGANAADIMGFVNFYPYASNLSYGQNFSAIAGDPIVQNANIVMAWGAGNAIQEFDVPAGTQTYLGFQFDVGAGTQQGWASLTADSGPGVNTFTLNQVGYGEAGEQIFIGQQPTGIPEPGSLACLALGAVGLVAYRRKRAVAA